LVACLKGLWTWTAKNSVAWKEGLWAISLTFVVKAVNFAVETSHVLDQKRFDIKEWLTTSLENQPDKSPIAKQVTKGLQGLLKRATPLAVTI